MKEIFPRDMMLGFFLTLFAISGILLGWLLWPFISIILLATVLTSIFSHIYLFLNKKIPPTISALLTCNVIIIVIFLPIVLFVGILSKEAYALYLVGKNAALGDLVKNLLEGSVILEKANLFLSNFNIEITGAQLNEALSQIGKVVGLFLYQQASLIASNVFNFFVYFFFMLLIIYFLLIDGHKLVSFIFNLSPLPEEQETKLINKFKDMAGAILIGNGLCGLIQGILGGVVFYLSGLKSPFMWGVIMALLAFLPIVGIGIVFIPAAVYLFAIGRGPTGIFFIVFYLILSMGIEYIVKPKLVGRQVKMHTLLVFLSIIGGLKLFGILGIIYGPLVVTAFLTLTDIYHSNYQSAVEPLNVISDQEAEHDTR